MFASLDESYYLEVENRKRVLVNKNKRSGAIEPLYRVRSKEGGISSNKTIASAIQSVGKALKKKLPAPKLIRKTSATAMDRLGKCGPYFLGHAPSGIAEKHYIPPSEEDFAEYLQQLREHYRDVF